MSRVDLEACVAHRVRGGETLDGLARGVGMTWRKLARFNFGVDDPQRVNRALDAYVGSIGLAADGRNVVFDDRDRPGVLYLPKVVREQRLSTGQAHTLRLATPRYRVPLELETVDELGRAVPSVELRLLPEGGGLELRATSGDSGHAHLDALPAGRYRVVLRDGTPAMFWRGRLPTRTPRARPDPVRLEPAVIDTLNRRAVTSLVVQAVSDQERQVRSLLRETHALTGELHRVVPRGESIREATAGLSRRSTRVASDTLLLTAGWADAALDHVDIDGLIKLLPGWLRDHSPVIALAGYYVVLLEPARDVITVYDRAGACLGEFRLQVNGRLVGAFGAYALYETNGGALYLDVANRTYPIIDEEHPKRTMSVEDLVVDKSRYSDVVRSQGWLIPLLLYVPTSSDLRLIAVNGGAGLLEDYPAVPDAIARVHRRNVQVCKNVTRAFDAYIRRYIAAVKTKKNENELRRLGPPLSRYEYPSPLGATDEQILELYEVSPSRELDAWKAIAAKLDELADRKSQGYPFLKLRVKYASETAPLVEKVAVRPELKALLNKVPTSIEVEGDLEVALDRDGFRIIRKGTKWSADVKLKATPTPGVEGMEGEVSLVKGTPSIIARGGAKPVSLTVKGPSAWDAVKGPFSGGKRYASAEIPDSSVGVKFPPFAIELKSDGSASISVDVEGATVESAWDPKSAEMSTGLSFSLKPLAEKLAARGGRASEWAKRLSPIEIGVTLGMVGLREETVLAVVSLAPGFFERRSTDALFDPATDWSSLTLDEQYALDLLGWTARTWNSKYDPVARQLPESCNRSHLQMSSREKVGIVSLGFYEYENYADAVETAVTKYGK